jgi:outer membrane protein OmpA-like peptidoglycan-associated protein
LDHSSGRGLATDHRVLVEGVAYDDESSCGAINVEPVHVSVFPELDTSCNTVLPDNGAAPREPSRFDLGAEMLSTIGAEQPMPRPLRADAEIAVEFPFGSTMLDQRAQQIVESAYKLAVASAVKSVEVIGWAASSRLEDGTTLSEPPALARRRADFVRSALISLGVDEQHVHSSAVADVHAADGVHDETWRRVVIRIIVSGEPQPRRR